MALFVFVLASFSIFLSVISKPMTNEDAETLKLVHVIFRHGDRTSEKSFTYPNDPNKNEQFFPYGRGELTNKGKKRMYRLGKALRERYDRFLGSRYHPAIVEAWSSLRNRTQASLQLVLAGLFPPTPDDIWEENIPWQPIPYQISSKKLFLGITCQNYQSIYEKYVNSPKNVAAVKKFEKVLECAAELSGRNITGLQDLLLFFLDLASDNEFGLKLAPWAQEIYPEKLEEAAIASYKEMTATTELRRISSGFLLQKILEDSEHKIKGTLSPGDRKIFLYSGHEITLANFLETLEVFQPQLPPYASYILIEMHKKRGTYGIKMYYQNYGSREPAVLKLPGCDQLCEIEKFKSLTEEYIPTTIDRDGCIE